jgi:diaminohydroxyphosphoribosylaminopyrimidine deaminase/5-amino-6-(5-phosphoribosylamino)uracil reductase
VVLGVLADEAYRTHRGHITRITQGRPSVILKLACTADGYAARRNGPRLMISGEASNARTHLMRAHADAIMVAIGTVLADDPHLTVRLPGLEARSPVRIIVDGRLRIPLGSRIVSTATEVPTWIMAAEDAPVDAERRLVDAGIEVMRVGGQAGRIDVGEGLQLLAARGITRIFSEGGPRFAEALIGDDLVDEVALSTNCNRLGEEGVPALGPRLTAALPERFRLFRTEDLGADRLEIFERMS